MRVILFQNRFAELVKTGQKMQTIRKRARCKPGDKLSLRRWTGKPYRSKQEVLREAVCVRVEECRIYDDGPNASTETGEMLARADGFDTLADMKDWFLRMHGLPFAGEKIVWVLTSEVSGCS